MKRAIIIVLDSVGIGALPDAADFGDAGSNTLVNIKKARPKTDLSNLCALGLGNIQGEGIALLGKTDAPKGAFGKMAEESIGKDTTTGHWEIAGIITKNPFPTYTEKGFPKEVIDAFEAAIGTKCIGNYAASGTVIIQDLGPEHVKTGYPIVYTSADSVFQIAAHEDVIPVEKLYEICEKARKILTGEHGVARVIARPFIGNAEEGFTRTKNRKDFSLEPTGVTILDLAKEKGMEVVAIGKIEDIFEHRGMTKADHNTNNADGIEKTLQFMKEDFEGILFTNLVDTDMIYGHRNDVEGYASALEYFDSKLPEIISLMKEDDILFITADHGCDPTTESTDHSREYVPVLAYGKKVKEGVDLGVRKTFADLGQTISDYLGLGAAFEAESFLPDILKTE
ncbi:MAG: phosphopentomutase [Anaerotignum sp.]|nr:phosphopentomutase [Anaerotignum sp.]